MCIICKFLSSFRFTHFFRKELQRRDETSYSTFFFLEIELNSVDNKCVPLVCLLINGGVGGLETAKNALENGTPVIAVQGSGRAADWLAYAVERPEVFVKPAVETDLRYQKEIGFGSNEKEIQLYIDTYSKEIHDLLHECVTPRVEQTTPCSNEKGGFEGGRKKQIIVLGTERFNDLDYAILKNLVEPGSEMSQKDQLKIAFKWNRSDEIHSLILDPKMKVVVGEFLREALVDNQLDFVKTIVNIEELQNFTRHDLFKVYKQTLKKFDHCEQRHCLQSISAKVENEDSEDCFMREIRKALESIGVDYDFFIPPNAKASTTQSRPNTTSSTKSTKDRELLDCAARDLFVYSVLFLRIDASLYFWQFVPFKVSAAIFAAMLIEAVSSSIHVEIRETIEKMKNTFEQKAIVLMNRCYENNEEQCIELLISRNTGWGKRNTFQDHWGNLECWQRVKCWEQLKNWEKMHSPESPNCLDLARRSGSKAFLEQTAVQKHVQEIWMGSLAKENSAFAIALNAATLVLVWNMRFKKNLVKKTSEKSKRNDTKGKEKSAKGSQKNITEQPVPQIIVSNSELDVETDSQVPKTNSENVTTESQKLASPSELEAVPPPSDDPMAQLVLPKTAVKERSKLTSSEAPPVTKKINADIIPSPKAPEIVIGYVPNNNQITTENHLPNNFPEKSTEEVSQKQEKTKTEHTSNQTQVQSNNTEERSVKKESSNKKSVQKKVSNFRLNIPRLKVLARWQKLFLARLQNPIIKSEEYHGHSSSYFKDSQVPNWFLVLLS